MTAFYLSLLWNTLTTVFAAVNDGHLREQIQADRVGSITEVYGNSSQEKQSNVGDAPAPQEVGSCRHSPRNDDIRGFYRLATAMKAGPKDQIMNTPTDPIHPYMDKVTAHSYELMYGMFLMPMRNLPTPPKILEIGLGCEYPWGTGVSQRLWRSMFPQSEVWGADFDAECVENSRKSKENDGIRFLKGDQKDLTTLDRWIERTGGGDFDVIIDDGGHSNLMIMHSFDKLFPRMKPGGLYFMEDLQMGRSNFDDTRGKAVVADILKDWMEQLIILKEDRRPVKHRMPSDVAFVFCQAEACVIGKAIENVRDEGMALGEWQL